MRSCRAGEPSELVIDPTAMAKRVAHKYTGNEHGVAFQQSKSTKSPASCQLVWKKGERLGITFVEKRGGRGVFVKQTAKRVFASLTGHDLVRVQGTSVHDLDIASVLRVLQASPSPCVLVFSPPQAPVTISKLSAEMKRSGVQPGMALVSIDGNSVVGSTLREVHERIEKASGSHPIRLEFALDERKSPKKAAAKDPAEDLLSPRQQAQLMRKANVRNGMSVAAVLAALSF
jgi:hypothetical protein